MMHRFSGALLLLALTAGCSAPASSRSGTAPSGPDPERLVLTEVADTAALARALASEPFLRSAADTALVSVHYDSTGAFGSVDFLHPEASEEDAARVEAIFEGQLAAAARPRTSAWLLLVRGDVPRVLPFEPSGEEAPRMLNRSELARALQTLASRPALRNREAMVWVFVGMDGAVKEAKVVETSGSIEADQALLEVAKQARFSPARLDRFPVPVWSQFPLSIRETEPASPVEPGPSEHPAA